MSRFYFILNQLLGDKEETGSERYFMTITCFSASIFLTFLSFVHFIMNINPRLIFLSGGSALVFLLMYFLVRFTRQIFIPKLVITIFGLAFLDITWYSKFLSYGPVLFFIFAFGALILWLWEGKMLIAMLTIYYGNIVLLFIMEYQSHNYISGYSDLQTRSQDIYLSFVLYSALMIFILSRVKNDFKRKEKQAIQSDKLKSAFLANMSHEIRTPMNVIMGFSDLLSDETDPESKKTYVNLISSSSHNLLNLINELIDLSKIEAGYFELNKDILSVKDLFIELKDIYSFELKKKEKTKISLDFQIPKEDYVIETDALRLKQILSNLISNAIKFTSEGSIQYSCIKIKNDLLFTVSDTGTGIQLKDQDQIFERFTKFDYYGQNREGSGIGLSIVKKLIELFGGKIWFESEYGKGSTFYFMIPHKIANL